MTIGTDPEILLRSNNGRPISAVGKVGGDKGEPFSLEEFSKKNGLPKCPHYAEGFGVLEDNVMVELNTPSFSSFSKNPESSLYYFLDGMDYVKQTLNRWALKNNLSLSYESDVVFSDKQLQSKQAKQFGCASDLNVYMGGIKPPINPEELGNRRFLGGHVHFGFPDDRKEEAVVLCDIILGILNPVYDPGSSRHQYYGQAGTYRNTSYGIEYRVPTNWWMSGSRNTHRFFNTCCTVERILHDGSALNRLLQTAPIMDVAAIINNNEVKEAKNILAYLRKNSVIVDHGGILG